jgi:hypothetical protein
MTIEMQPRDEADLDKWFREEHIPLLSKVPGYHRSTRYKWLPKKTFNRAEPPPAYLTLHEVDNVDCLSSEEAKTANNTAWTVRQVKESEKVIARAWTVVAKVNDGD